MATTTFLIIITAVGVLLQLHPVRSSFLVPQTKCPADNNGCTDDTISCSKNEDCDELSWCCPNSCGGKSCAVVKAPCTFGDKVYPHRGGVFENPPDLSNSGYDCALCWCFNGSIDCFRYDCHGAIP